MGQIVTDSEMSGPIRSPCEIYGVVMVARLVPARLVSMVTVLALATGLGAIADSAVAAASTCPTVSTSGVVTPKPGPDADWASCDLDGASLTHADLIDADLAGATFASANLTDADVIDANLSGTDLSTATLTGIFSGGGSGTPMLPANWEDVDSYLVGPGADLTTVDLAGAALEGADLAGTNLWSTNLTGADMAGANLTGANMTTALMTGTDITKADFSGVTLTGVQSSALVGSPVNMPSGWSLVDGYLIGLEANLAGADLAHASLTGMTLTGAFLQGANLTDADLAGDTLNGTFLYSADLSGADLSGTDLSDAYLAGSGGGRVESGGIIASPAPSLPADWMLVDGYLIGPLASLAGADLAGADLAGADLDDAVLSGSDLSGSDLSGADLEYAALDHASLLNATVTGANFQIVYWLDTICPNGVNSNKYIAGCFSQLNTTPPAAAPQVTSGTQGANGWYTSPVTIAWNWTDQGPIVYSDCMATSTTTKSGNPVTLTAQCTDLAGNVGTASYPVKVDTTTPAVSVTGVVAGHVYALGHVPAPGCKTTESVSGVALPATVSVVTTGTAGVGPFTATCAGAVSVAGTSQVIPVSLGYSVGYGFGGFLSPASGATVRRSAHVVIVRFRLDGANDRALAAALAASLARKHEVRVTLAGRGIRAVSEVCGWDGAARSFACRVRIPANVRTGRSHAYTITVAEDLGGGFQSAVPVGRSANPIRIHFS